MLSLFKQPSSATTEEKKEIEAAQKITKFCKNEAHFSLVSKCPTHFFFESKPISLDLHYKKHDKKK